MENAPRGEATPTGWLARFREAALEKLPLHLNGGSEQGSLHELACEDRPDGSWAVAIYSMTCAEGVTFIRSQRVIPDLSNDWEPEFAADLFSTHLVESFHTEAKMQAADASGFVRH